MKCGKGSIKIFAMEIVYPILNISIPEWNDDIVQEIFRYNDIYYSKDEVFFNKNFLGHEFVDCNGKIFRIVDKILMSNFWLRIFTLTRFRIIFAPTNKNVEFIDLQRYIIERINDLNGGDKISWINKIETAKNIRELIE